MKIIEIKNTSAGEVAYILDEQHATVFKVLVKDMTGISGTPRRIVPTYEEFEYEEEPAPRRRVRIPIHQVEAEDDQELPPPPNSRPAMKKNIMPPGIAEIFTPAGQQGEAIEKRTI